MDTKIRDDDELRRLMREGNGYVMDPFNRRWHHAGCLRLARMTTKDAKHHASSLPQAHAFMDRRMANNVTAKPLESCPSCSPAAGPRVPPSTVALATEHVQVDVVPIGRGFVATASHRVSYGPNHLSAAHEVRARLRTQISLIEPCDGEVLHAIFGGQLPTRSDVENQLLYNIFDASTAHTLVNGVRFELDDRRTGPPFVYSYAPSPLSAGFIRWVVGAERVSWPARVFAAGDPDHLLASTWWTLRTCGSHRAAPNVAAPYGASLEISPPAGKRVDHEALKKIVDGAVSAFQVHDASDEAIRRIAHTIDVVPEDVRSELRRTTRATLGRAQEAIRETKHNVQWGPDDTRLVAAEVRVTPSASPDWQISGRFFDVTRSNEVAAAV